MTINYQVDDTEEKLIGLTGLNACGRYVEAVYVLKQLLREILLYQVL